MATTTTTATPTSEELEELILCARYGEDQDLQDIKQFVDKYGKHWLAQAKDDRGNTCLHMAAGNGNTKIVSYLLPLLPTSSLSTQNLSLSTPLHWSSLNFHLPILRLLCPLLPRESFDLLNNHGLTAVQEAERACESYLVPEEEKEDGERKKERVRREIVVGYLLGVMGLDDGKNREERDKVDKMVEGVENEEDGVTKGVEAVSLDEKSS